MGGNLIPQNIARASSKTKRVLDQATQKILAKFSYPKKSRIKNFKPKTSFDHPRHLKSGVLPLGMAIARKDAD